MRRQLSCGDVDIGLGWQDNMPLTECDKCWAKGGPWTPEGKAWREGYVSLVVSAVRRAGVETFRDDVRHAMLDRHLPESEKAHTIARIKAHPYQPIVVWLGMKWEGVPWPKWWFICSKAAIVVFARTWKSLRKGGCGCNVKAKKAWRWLNKW